MEWERSVKITKGESEEVYTYYIRKSYSHEFKCDMYNVGIKAGGSCKEIEDFSVSLEDAEKLRDYLYKENVSMDNLFFIAEEFIVAL